jgi:branched-chain amino acid transport system ATP-binding protein
VALLEVDDLHTYYGNIHALQGVSLTVDAGEIVTLIGANGAGKSTTLKTISGLLRPRSGQVTLAGKPITAVPPHEIVARGLVHVPEGRGIFARLTVAENLELGTYGRADKRRVAEDLATVYDTFPRLMERRNQPGGTLSGGEQQMLAIGRGLMADPQVLLLDEPSMGLAPILVEEIFDIVQRLNRERQTTILLVEQNAQAALSAAHRGYVLETGRVELAGPAEVLRRDPRVVEAYLGV